MKKLLGIMIVISAAFALAMGTTGCNKPAATGGGDKDVKVTAPAEQKVKKDEEKTIEVALTRGKDAKNEAELTVAVAPADKGVTATLDPAKVAGDKKTTNLKLTAKAATEKEYTVTISGTSKDSAAIKAEFKVKVE